MTSERQLQPLTSEYASFESMRQNHSLYVEHRRQGRDVQIPLHHVLQCTAGQDVGKGLGHLLCGGGVIAPHLGLQRVHHVDRERRRCSVHRAVAHFCLQAEDPAEQQHQHHAQQPGPADHSAEVAQQDSEINAARILFVVLKTHAHYLLYR